ncbi:Uncharacterised protein [Mycobacteroides abscessus subsp. abscessus]|nr:Uncharacterised protein [Mycobacteroides abscessus subsp. abscessus]
MTELFHLGQNVAGKQYRTSACRYLGHALLKDRFHEGIQS